MSRKIRDNGSRIFKLVFKRNCMARIAAYNSVWSKCPRECLRISFNKFPHLPHNRNCPTFLLDLISLPVSIKMKQKMFRSIFFRSSFFTYFQGTLPRRNDETFWRKPFLKIDREKQEQTCSMPPALLGIRLTCAVSSIAVNPLCFWSIDQYDQTRNLENCFFFFGKPILGPGAIMLLYIWGCRLPLAA